MLDRKILINEYQLHKLRKIIPEIMKKMEMKSIPGPNIDINIPNGYYDKEKNSEGKDKQ
tara:strand:+ start:438 stop:614 length:177 start_codon:yes stop_codon:yes gene_type:complete